MLSIFIIGVIDIIYPGAIVVCQPKGGWHMQHIALNVYGAGLLATSIKIKLPDERDGTIGYLPQVMEYPFGKAEHQETITITSGVAVINGRRSDEVPGGTVVIPTGHQIEIVALTPVTYLCVYD